MGRLLHSLNVAAQCHALRVPLFSCPQFLFIVMGVINVVAMVGTNMVARRYAAPEVAAIVVLSVTAFLFVIGYIVTQSFERIAQTARAKAEFVSIISHQLRTPLVSIRWRLEKLLSLRTLDQEIRRDIAMLYRQEEYLVRMVNAMLEVNRIEDNALVLEKQAFTFRDLARRVVEEYRANIKEKGMTLSFKEDPADTLPVIGDSIRIRWVVENFIDNALRYSETGTAITITLARKGKYALMSVSDEGPGISPDAQKHLFTKFFRASEHTRLTTEGFGLGLFIAKAIIEAHGGSIGVVSPVAHTPLTVSDKKVRGKGSTFWFTLPLGG